LTAALGETRKAFQTHPTAIEVKRLRELLAGAQADRDRSSPTVQDLRGQLLAAVVSGDDAGPIRRKLAAAELIQSNAAEDSCVLSAALEKAEGASAAELERLELASLDAVRAAAAARHTEMKAKVNALLGPLWEELLTSGALALDGALPQEVRPVPPIRKRSMPREEEPCP
jgi:hypothetical protein